MRRRPALLTVTLISACVPAGSHESSSEPEPGASASTASAKFELDGPDQRERHVSWSAPQNLISCRHYAEPERGDYLWIRLAETPEQDGDAGVRLDIDVCRLGAITGAVSPMPAGQHGSHCATTPGFAIWWHEGEAAFNTGPAADPDDCWLTLDYEPASKLLRGTFECARLVEAETEPPRTHGGGALELTAGAFSCEVVAVSPSP